MLSGGREVSTGDQSVSGIRQDLKQTFLEIQNPPDVAKKQINKARMIPRNKLLIG